MNGKSEKMKGDFYLFLKMGKVSPLIQRKIKKYYLFDAEEFFRINWMKMIHPEFSKKSFDPPEAETKLY